MSIFFGPLIEKELLYAKYFMQDISFTFQKCAEKYPNFIDKNTEAEDCGDSESVRVFWSQETESPNSHYLNVM